MQGWARERFGDRADHVRTRIAAALLKAVGNAQDAQRWSSSDKQYAYGSTLMTRRYETLVEALRHEPTFQVVRPYGSPHDLVVLEGNLLLPFRYAEDDLTPITEARISDGRVSALVRELFRRFGPATAYQQEELDLGLEEAGFPMTRPVLAQLPDDTRLVPIAYAGNAHAGLLRLYWGEAELIDDFGRLHWLHCEPISLLAVTGPLPALDEVRPGDTAARFDRGAVPDLTISPRPAGEPVTADDEDSGETAVAAGDEHA